MDGVRSWVVGVARSVDCSYLYPKVVGLWGRAAGVRIFDTRPGCVWLWSGALTLVVLVMRHGWHTRAGAGDRWRLVALSSFIATEYNG